MKACASIAGTVECILLYLGQVHNIAILRYGKEKFLPNAEETGARRISGLERLCLQAGGQQSLSRPIHSAVITVQSKGATIWTRRTGLPPRAKF